MNPPAMNIPDTVDHPENGASNLVNDNSESNKVNETTQSERNKDIDILLEDENDLMEEAAEEQDLYNEVDRLSQETSEGGEPEKEKESRQDIILKLQRFKIIMIKKNEIPKNSKQKHSEQIIEIEKLKSIVY